MNTYFHNRLKHKWVFLRSPTLALLKYITSPEKDKRFKDESKILQSHPGPSKLLMRHDLASKIAVYEGEVHQFPSGASWWLHKYWNNNKVRNNQQWLLTRALGVCRDETTRGKVVQSSSFRKQYINLNVFVGCCVHCLKFDRSSFFWLFWSLCVKLFITIAVSLAPRLAPQKSGASAGYMY